ncbi:MAG: ABC transporter ATP-binding protein [Candidatus Omnitrophica bacterium]|nr:ABC transporter ATP-binding protein [Candidatus Omnitrophota bacterium]
MILEARNLHKHYNAQPAKIHVLRGIDLNIKKGEFVSILGSSGAGKSTLLHFLAGLDKPNKGEVLLNGQNIYTIRDNQRALLRNRDIGVVFQFYHLLPEFSAIDNIMFPALISGKKVRDVKARAEELMNEVGLANRKEHKPSALSGGEQQRVAIARALINSPQLLLCDEPTGNLDSHTGQKVCDLLLRLNKILNITIIIATHSKVIADISSRTLLIKDGKIE